MNSSAEDCMAMKIKEQTEPPQEELPEWSLNILDSVEGKTIPPCPSKSLNSFKREKRCPVMPTQADLLQHLFIASMQRSFLEAALSTKPPPVVSARVVRKEPVSTTSNNVVPLGNKVMASTMTRVTEIVPPPAKTPEAANDDSNVLPFPKREVVSKKAPKKRSGGGAGCQDLNENLKGWLASFNPIPNNVCLLENKERHIRETEKSRQVRLMKYGDSDHRPSVPDWVVQEPTKGWWGHRPPTLEQLFGYSRKIAQRLPEYCIDLETRSFVQNNLDRTFYAPVRNDPDDILLECGTLDAYDMYCAEWPGVPFTTTRVLSLNKAYLSSLPSGPERVLLERPKAVHYTPATGVAVTLSRCTDFIASVKDKSGAYHPTCVQDKWTMSFADLRKGQQRACAPWAVSYNALKSPEYSKSPDYRWEEYNQYATLVPSETEQTITQDVVNVEEDLRYYMALYNDEPAEEDRVYTAELMRTSDRIQYTRFLVKRGRENQDMATDYYEQPSFFALKGLPENDSEWCKDNWLLHRGIHNPPRSLCLYDDWWETAARKTDEVRLARWFLDRPGPAPDVVKRAPQCDGDQRWNTYVTRFNSYKKGRILKEDLEKFARQIWDVYWEVEPPTKVVVSDELAQWAQLMEDNDPPVQSGTQYEDWILPPEEINELVRHDTGEPIIPHHDDIVERIAQNRVRHLSLKRGWEKLKGKARNMRRPVTIEGEAKSVKANK